MPTVCLLFCYFLAAIGVTQKGKGKLLLLVIEKNSFGGKVSIYEAITNHYQKEHKSAKMHRIVCEF